MSIFFIFILGLFIGSFLNVLIERLSRNERMTGRSYCENCKKTLSWKDLIPVLSFVYLRGKCRFCKAELSYQYPIVELITGIMFVLTYLYLNNPISNVQYQMSNVYSIYYLFVVSCMIVIFFADLRHGIIPDKVLFPAIVVSLVYLTISTFYPLSSNVLPPIFNHLLSAIGAFLFFLLIYLITRGRGIGFGDVKLSFLMGLVLGYPGVFYSIYLAFLTGGAFAIILILWKKRKLKSQVAFGPFLVGNFLLVLFFQPQIGRFFSSLIS